MRRLFGPLLVTVAVGCSGGDGKTQVDGKVHLDGVPIAAGRINFFPVDGKTTTSSAEIVNGAYSVRVPQGAMRVEIVAPKAGKAKAHAASEGPRAEMPEESVPAKYNVKTELKADIAGATMELNFLDLRSK